MALEVPKQATAIAFRYPPGLGGKSLLLKKSHTLITGLEKKILLEWTEKLSPCWLAFIMFEGPVCAAGG